MSTASWSSGLAGGLSPHRASISKSDLTVWPWARASRWSAVRAFLLPSARGSTPSTPKSLSTRTASDFMGQSNRLPAWVATAKTAIWLQSVSGTIASPLAKENTHGGQSRAKELQHTRRDPQLRVRRTADAKGWRIRYRLAHHPAGLALVRARQAAGRHRMVRGAALPVSRGRNASRRDDRWQRVRR